MTVRGMLIAHSRRGVAVARPTRDNDPRGHWVISSGLPAHNVRAVARSPTRGTLWAGTRDAGLWRSDDDGGTWQPGGLPEAQVRSLAFGPLPDGATGQAVYVGVKPSGLYRSYDDGLTWHEVGGFTTLAKRYRWPTPSEWPPISYVMGIAPHIEDATRLAVGVEGSGGVWTTRDAGATWRFSRGSILDCHHLRAHPHDAEALYEGGAGLGGAGAISRDGGKTWQRIRTPREAWYGWAIAVDAHDPDFVYVGANQGPGLAHGTKPSGAHLYRVEAGARPVELTGPGAAGRGLPKSFDSFPYALATHASEPRVVYAGLADGTIWRGEDAGEKWRRLDVATDSLWAMTLW